MAIAFLLAQRLHDARRHVANQDFLQASASLDPFGAFKDVGYALVILTVAAAGWWAHQVDVGAELLAKFHKKGSWLVALAPVLLLPLFELNEHLNISKAGRSSGIDMRPGVVAVVMALVLWLPASRIKAAVVSMGSKLPIRAQAEPSLVTSCIMAASPLCILALAIFFEGAARVDLLFLSLLIFMVSFFASFTTSRRAVASVRGDTMTMRTWSAAISLWFAIQYFANILRPPNAQQVLLLAIATAVLRAGAIVVALKVAMRVTAAADETLHEFHQVKRIS